MENLINSFAGHGDPTSAWGAFFHSTSEVMIRVVVFVAIGLIIVELLNYFAKDKLIKGLQHSKKTQPLFGSILGLIPGSGGAIFLVPFYHKGQISFATLVAAFISTMGEAAFIILVINPMAYLWISLVSFITSLVVGYIIMFTKLNGFFESKSSRNQVKVKEEVHHHNRMPQGFAFFDRTIMPIFLFGVLAVILPTSIIEISVPHEVIHGTWVESMVEVMEWLAFVSTLFLVSYYFLRSILINNLFKWDDRVHVHSGKQKFSHIARDLYLNILYITTWVAIGLVSVDMLIYFIGADNIAGWLTIGGGVLTLFLVVLIGVIPGCGPQILVLNMYTGGMIGGSAIAANAIIQDGDAGFPLLSKDKKAFMWIKLANLVPGLLVGGTLLIIENFASLPW